MPPKLKLFYSNGLRHCMADYENVRFHGSRNVTVSPFDKAAYVIPAAGT